MSAPHTTFAGGVDERNAGESQLRCQTEDLGPTGERRARLIERDQLASLGRLVAGVAHEINNPLAAVTGMLELLKDIVGEREHVGPQDTQVLRELILECESAADRIRQLVFSLKDLGRTGVREALLFDPARMLRDAVRLFAAAKRGRCRVELSASALLAVRGSSARLGQVIINLLQNGLDAAGDGSTLVVRGDACNGEVRILVSDDGPGIPADVASRVFEPFFSTKGGEGMGLGLSICREIVADMGGTIDFETGPTGTTFRVLLPGCHPDQPRLTAV